MTVVFGFFLVPTEVRIVENLFKHCPNIMRMNKVTNNALTVHRMESLILAAQMPGSPGSHTAKSNVHKFTTKDRPPKTSNSPPKTFSSLCCKIKSRLPTLHM